MYLSASNVELEWLSSVSRRVDLLAIGQGQDVMAGNLLARLGEGGAIPGGHGFDIDAHFFALARITKIAWVDQAGRVDRGGGSGLYNEADCRTG